MPRALRLRRNTVLLIFIAALAAGAVWIIWPQRPERYFGDAIPWPKGDWLEVQVGNSQFVRRGMTLGLDLQGGTHLVLEADLEKRPAGSTEVVAMEGVRRIIERRINAFGVSEPIIQQQGNNRVSVQLPGVKDTDDAKRLIGRTAQLDFRELETDPSGQLVLDELGQPKWKKATATGNDGQQKELTGAMFRPNAALVFDPQTSQPNVSFEFDDEGANLFEQITGRMIGKPLGIFLDDRLISAPTVQAVISQQGVITGIGAEEGRLLSVQLNAGALPVPVTIIKEQTVDATLGQDSIQRSIVAGMAAFVVTLLFMVLNYRLPGVVASLALVIYAALTLAVFKLVPVTLTLAGIAAFILSVGMAVDANILIFERMREELRRGRTVGAAIEEGFNRAWPSIRDSNVSTMITCVILYYFGSNFGASLIMGFALTLALGVIVSMFSAIIVSRTFLRAFAGTRIGHNPALLGMD